MKLRNKKTGNIVDFCYLQNDYIAPLVLTFKMNDKPVMRTYNSLAGLNEEWEDYQEPKEYWYIEPNGVIARIDEWDCCTASDIEIMKTLGNYFETKEEAERVAEKLKAWKRLGEKGFRFEGWYGGSRIINFKIGSLDKKEIGYIDDDTANDLDLLFRR